MSHLRFFSRAFKNKHMFSTATPFCSTPIYIVAGKRTPIGTNLGPLSALSAKDLGVVAVQGALASINLPGSEIQEACFGHVYVSGQGQNTARQVSMAAGKPPPNFIKISFPRSEPRSSLHNSREALFFEPEGDRLHSLESRKRVL